MKLLFFLIPLFVLIPQVFADSTIIEPENNSNIITIPLGIIEDGSQIKSTSFTLTIPQQQQTYCIIKLIDDYLDPIPISDKFVCQGIHTIQLDKKGTDALQSKLPYDSFKFSIVLENQKQVTVFTISDIEVTYDTPKYFAEIKDGKVTSVIVADNNFVSDLGGQWKETGKNIRGHYAGIDELYDAELDVFIKPLKDVIYNFDSFLGVWDFDLPMKQESMINNGTE